MNETTKNANETCATKLIADAIKLKEQHKMKGVAIAADQHKAIYEQLCSEIKNAVINGYTSFRVALHMPEMKDLDPQKNTGYEPYIVLSVSCGNRGYTRQAAYSISSEGKIMNGVENPVHKGFLEEVQRYFDEYFDSQTSFEV